MPIFFTDTEDDFKLGVWEITESQEVLEQNLSYRSNASHAARRLQQLAARKMILFLNPEFPFEQVMATKNGKPFLADGSLEFSMSHCNGFAAAITGLTAPVGIDIELVSSRASRIAGRFLNKPELDLISKLDYGQHDSVITLLWSAKETIYKWWGRRGLDFAANIQILQSDWMSFVEFKCFFEGGYVHGKLHAIRFDDMWLTYIHGKY